MEAASRVRLTAMVTALSKKYGQPAKYSAAWRLVTSGLVPAEMVSGRLYMNPADEDRLAEALGLRERRPTAA